MEEARSLAARYESTLPPDRRKALGQFFSGLTLGRLLAALAIENAIESVIDPMAGNGDLLDAATERAIKSTESLRHVHGVEIDRATAEVCGERLQLWRPFIRDLRIDARDAFSIAGSAEFISGGYDLVITNPPYVRYQTLSVQDSEIPQCSPAEIRKNLVDIVRGRVDPLEFPIWRTLISGYSGLADLSVPSWILAASLVRPGGTLALVAPATWRSRNYGSVIAYLLARCFEVQYVIEDTQPGWFSEALVRTQLVVARRLSPADTVVPLIERDEMGMTPKAVSVSPSASDGASLVGSAFPGPDPERSFADWVWRDEGRTPYSIAGIKVSDASLNLNPDDFDREKLRWLSSLEPLANSGPLFVAQKIDSSRLIPNEMRHLIDGIEAIDAVLPETLGLHVSQGLRTGCNGFFYVEQSGTGGNGAVVRLSKLFHHREIVVPEQALLPVVRRQAEVNGPVKADRLSGRALVLEQWILPEDAATVSAASIAYQRSGLPIPQVMPPQLADAVRNASATINSSSTDVKLIPELSAVKTNARLADEYTPPRFWYMLPRFGRRHLPDAFIPRINSGIPWVEVNDDPPVLIDANFSTIWSDRCEWTPFAVRAVLNSSWCRACMEALGTPLGAGALKLEATQLNRLPLPHLDRTSLAALHDIGVVLTSDAESLIKEASLIVLAGLTGKDTTHPLVSKISRDLEDFAQAKCRARQRTAHD